MPLVGGGGAGNVAGSNPAGTGTGLNYVGDFAYALSPSILSSVAYAGQTRLLIFNTESAMINAEFMFSGFCGVNGGSASNGGRGIMTIKYNGEVVMQVMSDTDSGNMMATIVPKMIIPPYTQVEVLCTASVDSADYAAVAVVSGRVYA